MSPVSKVLVMGLAVLAASVLAIALEPFASFRWAATTLVLAVPFMLAACSGEAIFGALAPAGSHRSGFLLAVPLPYPVWLLCMHWLDDQPVLPRVALCVTVSLIVAGLSYRYIERPLTEGAVSREPAIDEAGTRAAVRSR